MGLDTNIGDYQTYPLLCVGLDWERGGDLGSWAHCQRWSAPGKARSSRLKIRTLEIARVGGMALGGEGNEDRCLSERSGAVVVVFCEEIFLRCARGLRLRLALQVSNEGRGGAQGLLRLEERSSSVTAKSDLGRRHLAVALLVRVVVRECVGRSGLVRSSTSFGVWRR